MDWRWIGCAGCAVAALAGWSAPARAGDLPLPCGSSDKACLIGALETHIVRKGTAWRAALARPVVDRVAVASPELAQYLRIDNAVNGFPELPRPAQPSAAFLADVRGALEELPPAVLRLFDQRLAGIFLVDDLGGTGYTDFVYDERGRRVGGMIVLDAAVLARRTANAWATWKENSAFRADTGWALRARIESDANDTRRNAIQFILLHELAHVLSIGSDLHPPWDLDPKEVPATARYPFYDLSWRVERNRYVSKFDAALPERPRIVYYLPPLLDAREMDTVYTHLAQTNFASLYAATKPGDDFAETFATYVHTVLLGKPWEITISRDGKVVRTFRACWDEPRCAAKRKLLEAVLARP